MQPADVPVCETTEELNEVWKNCKSQKVPAVAVEKVGDGYSAKYDFHHLSKQLTDSAKQEVETLLESKVDSVLRRAGREEGVGFSAGQSSGRIFPIPKDDAKATAAEFSEVVLDSSNWEEYPGWQ
jgi:hypothetical protein